MKMLQKGFVKVTVLSAVATAALALGVLALHPTKANACWFCSNGNSSLNTDVDYWKSTQKKEAVITEDNQRRMLKVVPVPKVENSQERKNIVRRLETFNADDKVSYIYLVNYGKVMAFYTIKGKVSSVNSMLTTPQQLVDYAGNQCGADGASRVNCWVLDSPDIDGSYGSNGDAIFFFTTEGAYVEWHGDYMLSDQPLQLTTQPELVREVK